MRLSSSSTSSSKRRRALRRRAVAITGLWTLLGLGAMDTALQVAFRMPADARQQPGSMAQYFHYGTSIEGKLKRMVAASDDVATPVVLAGWIDKDCVQAPPPPAKGALGITLYGSSFTQHVAGQLKQIDPALAVAQYAGPGAPLNHSYACFQKLAAAGTDQNSVQIIGVLASSVSRMATLGGLTTSFEVPTPFTYPRYYIQNGKLVGIEPVVRAPADLRDAGKMARYREQLAQHDAFYDPLLYNANVLDHSLTLKLFRRAFAQAEDRRISAEMFSGEPGFVENPQVAPVMRAMLLDFAQKTRSKGKVPVVILFQDRGTGADTLYRMLGPALEQAGVPLVSSHTIASVDDPRNFIADGHFTPEVDRKIAEAVLAEARKAMAARGPLQ